MTVFNYIFTNKIFIFKLFSINKLKQVIPRTDTAPRLDVISDHFRNYLKNNSIVCSTL